MGAIAGIKRLLEPFPKARAFVKRVYQLIGYTFCNNKIVFEGDFVRVTPMDDYEYFYGYYDKSPWDSSERYIISNKVKTTYKDAESKEECAICVIDTMDYSIKEICKSHSWNVQQGCMAQWIGPDFHSKMIYNDYRNGHFCSVIFNVEQNSEEKEIPMPVYDVSKDGKFALSLDFSRLHYLRNGYGYCNELKRYKLEKCPDKCCIWYIDLGTGKNKEVLSFSDLIKVDHKSTMDGAYHKVNHIMINPSGNRFMFIHRWIKNGKKYSRLITANIDGSHIYNLSDDTFVSHCFWRDDETIIAFLRKNSTGDHYYLLTDKTDEYKLLWLSLKRDGHCSYSPDGTRVITDTYPDSKRISTIYLGNPVNGEIKPVGRVFVPFRYDNDVRCDLHPRWNRSGTKISIDGCFSGKRGVYTLDV